MKIPLCTRPQIEHDCKNNEKNGSRLWQVWIFNCWPSRRYPWHLSGDSLWTAEKEYNTVISSTPDCWVQTLIPPLKCKKKKVCSDNKWKLKKQDITALLKFISTWICSYWAPTLDFWTNGTYKPTFRA